MQRWLSLPEIAVFVLNLSDIIFLQTAPHSLQTEGASPLFVKVPLRRVLVDGRRRQKVRARVGAGFSERPVQNTLSTISSKGAHRLQKRDRHLDFLTGESTQNTYRLR